MDTYERILFLFLGWLLGLLSPIIVEIMQNKRRKKETRLGLMTELEEAKYRLIGTVYLLSSRLGNYDRELLTWLNPMVDDFGKIFPGENILANVKSNLLLNDEELTKLSQHLKSESGRRPSLKTFELPFLDSKVGSLTLFDSNFQIKVMEIRAQIHLLNEEIEQARNYFNLTFNTSIGSENHMLVCQNLDNCYRMVIGMARRIVDQINKLRAL